MKTDEEGFAERLADMNVSDETKFEEAYANLFQEYRKKKLNKLARVISNERMVKMYASLLSLGRRFRSMHQFTMTHVNAKFIGIHGGVSNHIPCSSLLMIIAACHGTYSTSVRGSSCDCDTDRISNSIGSSGKVDGVQRSERG
jgi:hypothetical protein